MARPEGFTTAQPKPVRLAGSRYVVGLIDADAKGTDHDLVPFLAWPYLPGTDTFHKQGMKLSGGVDGLSWTASLKVPHS